MSEDRKSATASVPESSGDRFLMDGARELLSLAPNAVHIENQIRLLERAVEEDPGLAFDTAKSLVESICKTILKDRGQVLEGQEDLPQLVKRTLRCLAVVPDGYDNAADATDSLGKATKGLATVIQGLCELRRQEGTVSHGRDAYERTLESIQAHLAARAADAIVCFLFKCHRSYATGTPFARLQYTDSPDFNEYVDEANELVQIFDLAYGPSEVLFHVDEEAYRGLLADYRASDAAEDEVSLGKGGMT